jgi:hypothetical protein
MVVHIAPTNAVYETGPSNERINFTMNHELAHIVTLDQATGSDRFFRTLFLGKVRESAQHPETMVYDYLTVPRRAAPRWHREGAAVFFETWMAGGLGRAQGPYDEMVFRAMVRDSSRFYDPLGLEAAGTKVDFQIGVNAYLYGTRFTTWLADRYSPDQFVEWVARRPGSSAYFAQQFHQVFGRPLGDAWQEWVTSERRFQHANLDSIRLHPVTPSRDLTARPLGSVSRPCLDSLTRTLYVAVQYPGQVGHIAALPLDGGPIRKLHEVKGPALYFVSSLAWDPDGRTLFYTADNDGWRDLCALDPRTRRSRVLMRDARVGDLAFDRTDRTLWAVRHFNGISTVVQIPPPYTDYRRVLSMPYGRDCFDLDVSADGQWVAASVGEIDGHHALHLMRKDALAAGDTTSRSLFDFGVSIPTSFVFSGDGRFLYGSSYYTGVSNIFRYDLAADSMDVVSNAETGFFRPLPLAGDSVLVFRYSGAGFVPAVFQARPLTDVSAVTFFGQQVVERHPELETWKVPPPNSVHLDSLGLREGPYRSFRSVRLVSLFPMVEAYKDRTSPGLATILTDPAGFHQLDASASYSFDENLPDDERWHFSAAYKHSDVEAQFQVNPASFYDLFGPTKVSRKGVHGALGWRHALLRDEPRVIELALGLTSWTGLERLPGAQNIAVSPDFDRLFAPTVELSEKDLRSSLGSVDYEKGYQWSLSAWMNHVRFRQDGSRDWRDFPQFEATLDGGVPLPLSHSSIWIRGATGYSPGDRFEPFANFFFGGFGNNWVDSREVKRYRQAGQFPGVPLDAVAGTNYAKATLEWNLPPFRFERVGTPAFYATWLRLSLFSTALATNVDDDALRRELADAGAQADVRFQLFARQPLTLSGGYARAFEKDGPASDEWMLSLKIL